MSSLLFRRFFSPDPAAGGGTIQPGIPEPIDRTPWLPTKDADVNTVAAKIAQSWTANTQITLIWMTATQFTTLVNGYAASVGTNKTAAGNRPAQTQALMLLDKEIDTNLSDMKIDIQRKFGKANALAQYSRYGMEKVGTKGYVLPKDRDNRILALKMIAPALTADGINGTYNAAYWTTMVTKYQRAMSDAGTTDSTVSAGARTKNAQKDQILKVMRALQNVLRGNYPDNYEAIFRQWGWQKEDY